MTTIAPHEIPTESRSAHDPRQRSPAATGTGGLAARLAGMRRGLAGSLFLALGVAAWWWLTTHHFTGGSHGPAVAERPGATVAAAAPGQSVVVLPPSSQSAADIGLATVGPRAIRDRVTVPGRLDYDARYRLDYASPVDGIVPRVFVTVRQQVKKGDSLAEVSSPEVGRARDDIRKREDDREIAKKAADWSAAIADNVDSLLKTLSSHPPLPKVEEEFQDRLLGIYREKILGSYSRLLYVEKVNASTKQLGEGGVLSGRIIEERTSNLEVAKANFTAACEEALFLTRQDRDRAKEIGRAHV